MYPIKVLKTNAYYTSQLEEAMATHCRILPRKIPWTEEPGGLQSMRSQRVGHDRATEYEPALQMWFEDVSSESLLTGLPPPNSPHRCSEFLGLLVLTAWGNWCFLPKAPVAQIKGFLWSEAYPACVEGRPETAEVGWGIGCHLMWSNKPQKSSRVLSSDFPP